MHEIKKWAQALTFPTWNYTEILNQNLIEELEGGEDYLKIQESGSTFQLKIFFSPDNTKIRPLSLTFLSFFLARLLGEKD